MESKNLLVKKFSGIEPHPEGMQAMISASQVPCVVVSQCDCTSPLLHYLVRLNSGVVMSVQHNELTSTI